MIPRKGRIRHRPYYKNAVVRKMLDWVVVKYNFTKKMSRVMNWNGSS